LNAIADKLRAKTLTVQEQGALLLELKSYLDDEKLAAGAYDLLVQLGKRPDVLAKVKPDIDNTLREYEARVNKTSTPSQVPQPPTDPLKEIIRSAGHPVVNGRKAYQLVQSIIKLVYEQRRDWQVGVLGIDFIPGAPEMEDFITLSSGFLVYQFTHTGRTIEELFSRKLQLEMAHRGWEFYSGHPVNCSYQMVN
jgi:hypothetical protein